MSPFRERSHARLSATQIVNVGTNSSALRTTWIDDGSVCGRQRLAARVKTSAICIDTIVRHGGRCDVVRSVSAAIRADFRVLSNGTALAHSGPEVSYGSHI